MKKPGVRNDQTGRTGVSGAAGDGRSGWPGLVWAAVGLVLALAGSVGAVAVATAQSDHNAENARHVLASSSADVASSLRLAIQREEDLVVSAGGFVTGDPHASNAQFQRWVGSVR